MSLKTGQTCQPTVSVALRWGICGPGNTANDFLMSLSTLEKGAHVITAIASRSDQEKAREMARNGKEKYGDWLVSSTLTRLQRGVYRTYAHLAKDPDVDVVYCGVTHPYRHLVVEAALAHNKPCLVENPMTVTADMAATLIACAQQKRIFLLEALWSTFMPSYHYLRDVLAGGTGSDGSVIGTPKLLTCHMGYKERPCLPLHKLKDKQESGGTLMDIGIYGLNVAYIAFRGEDPKKITASGTMYDTGVDEMVNITLLYSSNRMAVLTVTTNTARPKSEAVVLGTKGSVKLCHPFWCCEEVEVVDKDGVATRKTFPVQTANFNFVNSGGLAYQADEVRRCLLNNQLESPLLPVEASLQFRRITDEVRRQLGVEFAEDHGIYKT